MLLAVQLSPLLVLRVLLTEPTPRELLRMSGATPADGGAGAALRAAVVAVVTGVLSSMAPAAAAAAVARAQELEGVGGFVVYADPTSGDVLVELVPEAGAALGEGIRLGGIVPGPTLH